MNPNAQLQELKNGNKEVLSSIYLSYRTEFVNWLKVKYKIDTERALDLYQQTIVVFYENILQGKLVEINSQLKTYLFAIGKNKLMEEIRVSKKVEQNFELKEESIPENEEEQREERIKQIKESLQKLGDHCKQLLQLFYYQNLSFEEIMVKQGYKNKNTAKNQKYKCMEQLRKIHKAQKEEVL
jgi:RNA polymerase sigma-70 factor (ECF subfamily)